MNRTTLVEKLRKRGMITPAAARREAMLADIAAMDNDDSPGISS
jgi:hypothetical protein